MPDEIILDSQIIRELGDLARELGKLKDTPAWARLQAEFDKAKDTFVQGQARKLVSGGSKAEPLDQRMIDYQRGFFRGCEHILAMPDRAEQTLNKALEKQEMDQ